MKALVITSIALDTLPALNTYAKECSKRGIQFIIVGDTKSPKEFNIEGCEYWNIELQKSLPFELAKIIPEKHYSRKNLGYLIAIKKGCNEIQETDDDNIPYEEFWEEKNSTKVALSFTDKGWINTYSYFSHIPIWARGFPLEELQKEKIELPTLPISSYCPIQQGLADGNPDVDAIYRLTNSNFLPITFYKNSLILGKNSWSPFNSQNTYWFKESFALLYLPSYCSFRMTDIWRSYVAQRIAWECGWSIFYHEATVTQERNEHNLMVDFEEEIIGYKNNFNICKELQELNLRQGKEYIFENLITCYEKLVDIGVVAKEEMILLNTWINDLKNIK